MPISCTSTKSVAILMQARRLTTACIQPGSTCTTSPDFCSSTYTPTARSAGSPAMARISASVSFSGVATVPRMLIFLALGLKSGGRSRPTLLRASRYMLTAASAAWVGGMNSQSATAAPDAAAPPTSTSMARLTARAQSMCKPVPWPSPPNMTCTAQHGAARRSTAQHSTAQQGPGWGAAEAEAEAGQVGSRSDAPASH